MRTLLPAILVLSVGCTTSRYMRDADPTPAPGPDEAKVVVYRDSVLGGVDRFPVYAVVDGDPQLLGFTETGAYFEVLVKPGKILFLTWCEGEAYVDADLAPGETLYLRAWSKFGLIYSRPGLAPETPTAGDWAALRPRQLDPVTSETVEQRMKPEARAVLSRIPGTPTGMLSSK